MLFITTLFISLFAVHAQAEPCPTYNEQNPVMVMDVAEYKFFYYPASESDEGDSVLVEKAGSIFGYARVRSYSDEMSDNFVLDGGGVFLRCGLSDKTSVYAKLNLKDGSSHSFTKGECREVGHSKHPLVCGSER